jgi:hypothetical protein
MYIFAVLVRTIIIMRRKRTRNNLYVFILDGRLSFRV